MYIYGKQSDRMHIFTQNMQILKVVFLLYRTSEITKNTPKTDHSIAIFSIFLIGMVYFLWYVVNPHVQTVQNMYGKGG